MSEPHHREKPTERAFVIQFQPEPPGSRRRRFQGRVEQVASGETARFRSLRELVTFIQTTLTRRFENEAE